MSRSVHLAEVLSESRHQAADSLWPGSAQDRVHWLLQQSSIKELIDRNERFADEISSAVSVLAEHPKLPANILERAVLKSAEAIVYGIKVFISYKTSEEETARRFLDLLQSIIKPRMNRKDSFPFLAGYGSSIKAGADWREKIHDSLESTHRFFLLKPDDTVDPDWLVFEAGYFRRGMMPGDKLICIYGTNATVPEQIKNLQGVRATEDKLLGLLEDLVLRRNAVPGMESIDDQMKPGDLRRIASEMAAIFVRKPAPEIKRRYFVNYVDLDLNNIEIIRNGDDIRNLKVLQVEGSEAIFGRPFQTSTFGEFISNIDSSQQGNQWVEQLARALGEALGNRSLTQPTITFRGYRDRCVYRPFISPLKKPGFDRAALAGR